MLHLGIPEIAEVGLSRFEFFLIVNSLLNSSKKIELLFQETGLQSEMWSHAERRMNSDYSDLFPFVAAGEL